MCCKLHLDLLHSAVRVILCRKLGCRRQSSTVACSAPGSDYTVAESGLQWAGLGPRPASSASSRAAKTGASRGRNIKRLRYNAKPVHQNLQMLKNIFVEVKNKFETAIGILKKEKITIDPEDPAVVSHYAKVMKTIREKASLLSESQDILSTIEIETQDIPDARTYLLTFIPASLFCDMRGLTDDLGAEALMIDALDKVEKDLKKPLLRNDKKGMDLLLAEFDKINKKLGIRKEDLPKYEEELELKVAKAQLEELKKDALEAMETQKKRYY
ncbi:Putative ATP synthase 24 kDa subunit, mitochondrial [Glycine soja]|uniref:Putative ATP synthase 24 kDa subunit, mitochondrial n=1 Tax=Glycine soja TaxID=3848 RepID=A0A0B2QZ67_GLYSO|nr:Putative ATP synthase 24 kDa subunit, mitochondrial [Glycine soja]